ncbi:hypothetical protein PIB30_053530, partial [Stylosanthes scabra]|nr:hypothetical protein [Stylosanthes scabra]
FRFEGLKRPREGGLNLSPPFLPIKQVQLAVQFCLLELQGDKSSLLSPNTQQSNESSNKGDTSTYPGSATTTAAYIQSPPQTWWNSTNFNETSCFFLIGIHVACWWRGVRMGQSSAKVGAATLHNARRAMLQSRLPSLLSFVCFNVLVQSWPSNSFFGSKLSSYTLQNDSEL